MSKIGLIILTNIFCFSALGETLCGKTTGFSYNQDTIKRPYKLSGFWLKQNTKDIRVTYGNSPELIKSLENLDGNIFICIDEYELVNKLYAGKPRTYAKVETYRIWLNGSAVKLTNENTTAKQEYINALENFRDIDELITLGFVREVKPEDQENIYWGEYDFLDLFPEYDSPEEWPDYEVNSETFEDKLYIWIKGDVLYPFAYYLSYEARSTEHEWEEGEWGESGDATDYVSPDSDFVQSLKNL